MRHWRLVAAYVLAAALTLTATDSTRAGDTEYGVIEERATRPVITQEGAPGPSRPDEATLPRQVTTTGRDADSPSTGSVLAPTDTRLAESGVAAPVGSVPVGGTAGAPQSLGGAGGGPRLAGGAGAMVPPAVSPPSGLLTSPPPNQVQMPTPGLSPTVPTSGATSTPSISTPTPVSNVTPVPSPTVPGSTPTMTGSTPTSVLPTPTTPPNGFPTSTLVTSL